MSVCYRLRRPLMNTPWLYEHGFRARLWESRWWGDECCHRRKSRARLTLLRPWPVVTLHDSFQAFAPAYRSEGSEETPSAPPLQPLDHSLSRGLHLLHCPIHLEDLPSVPFIQSEYVSVKVKVNVKVIEMWGNGRTSVVCSIHMATAEYAQWSSLGERDVVVLCSCVMRKGAQSGTFIPQWV